MYGIGKRKGNYDDVGDNDDESDDDDDVVDNEDKPEESVVADWNQGTLISHMEDGEDEIESNELNTVGGQDKGGDHGNGEDDASGNDDCHASDSDIVKSYEKEVTNIAMSWLIKLRHLHGLSETALSDVIELVKNVHLHYCKCIQKAVDDVSTDICSNCCLSHIPVLQDRIADLMSIDHLDGLNRYYKQRTYVRDNYCYVVSIQSHTVKLVYNDTTGATKMCCYNQVVVVTRTFSIEVSETVTNMCVVVKRLML